MALIQLTKGLCAIVDDALFESLNQHKWYASGVKGKEYAARRLCNLERTLIYMHHEVIGIMPWELNGNHIDHDDGFRLNNKRSNLKLATPSQNQLNSDRVRNQKGIGIDRTHGTYKAYVNLPGRKRINVGTYQTEQDAIDARERFLKRLGEPV